MQNPSASLFSDMLMRISPGGNEPAPKETQIMSLEVSRVAVIIRKITLSDTE